MFHYVVFTTIGRFNSKKSYIHRASSYQLNLLDNLYVLFTQFLEYKGIYS